MPQHPFSSKQFSCLRQHDSNKSALKVYWYKCHVVSVRSQTKANFSKHFLLELPQHFNRCLLESSEAKQAPIRVWNKTKNKVNCGRIIFFLSAVRERLEKVLRSLEKYLFIATKVEKLTFLSHTHHKEKLGFGKYSFIIHQRNFFDSFEYNVCYFLLWTLVITPAFVEGVP